MNKIKIKDLYDYKLAGNLQKIGKYTLCSIQQMNEKKNSYETDIYYLHDDYTLTALTGNHHTGHFVVEDDTHILFYDSRDNSKDTVYYRLPLDGGESIEAYRFKESVVDLLVDDKYLVLSIEENLYEKEDDYVVLHEIPYVANGQGFIDGTRIYLAIYNKETKEITRITEKYGDVGIVEVKNHSIYFTMCTWKDVRPHFYKLYCYDLNTKKLECLIEEDYHINDFVVDDTCIYLLMNDWKDYQADQYDSFYVYDLVAKAYHKVTDYDYPTFPSVSSDVASRGGKSLQIIDHELYFISTPGYYANIYKLSNDQIVKLTNFNGVITSYMRTKDGYLVIGMKEGLLPEIYTIKDQEVTKHSDFSCVLKEKSVVKVHSIPFINRKGMRIDGFILYPVDYQKGNKYPGILTIHGGPRGAYGDIFFHEMQLLANQNYFVFYINPQGSDGYGQEFGDMRMQYGKKDYDDFMDFMDFILKQYPDIDSSRLGVMGGSYGGFMTNWITSHTTMFKAACTQRSISDWISDFGTSGISFDDALHMGARPWNRAEDMWQDSPLKYAKHVKTPTLIIHSFEDHTCDISQGLEWFTALKMLGVECKAVLFKGENHGLSRRGKPSHRERRLKEIVDWMNSHLKEVQDEKHDSN